MLTQKISNLRNKLNDKKTRNYYYHTKKVIS
ncbi:hypothetical protein [Candidatus Williamhamiltonella defendens]|nr:hypothetical protein [Candidatus Hamiltonella defensa]